MAEKPGFMPIMANSRLVQARDKVKKNPVVQNLEFIQKGCKLTKVRGKGNKYKRFFQMESDLLSFGYNDSRKVGWWRNMIGSGKGMSKVFISEIQEVRDGPMTDVFVKSKLNVPEEHCFSVVVGEKHKTLDLVAPTKEIKDAWITSLRHVVKRREEAGLSTQQEVWMKELFQFADKNGDNALNLKEIVGLLQHLNIEVDLETAKSVFEEWLEKIRQADYDKTKNKQGEDALDIDEFMQFYKIITSREEVEDIFESYNYEGKYLDTDELGEFLLEEECEEYDEDELQMFIDEWEPCPQVKSQQMMSLDGFNSMFNSPMMDIFSTAHRVVYQDMDQPLSHYYIDSSHNTYLTDDQLWGPSAVEAYIRAMKRGCRCVELDCWDGDKGEPVIYHGYTLTSKILFRDVITAVNMYAFEASTYPLILSIENHCSVPQQHTMAQLMKEILGPKLLTEPLPEDAMQLPSPNQLQGRIIIKAKKLSAHAAKAMEEAEDEEGYVSDEDEAADIEVGEEEKEEVKEKLKTKKKKGEKHKLAKELSDCVVICQSVSFKGFEHATNNYSFKAMSSYTENKAVDLGEKQTREWMMHNTLQLSRTYPAGRRTDSSNYDPMPMWLGGAQIVALNYQTPDESMHLYKGKFIDNGGCGYVLKPDFMRTTDTRYKGVRPYDSRKKKRSYNKGNQRVPAPQEERRQAEEYTGPLREDRHSRRT